MGLLDRLLGRTRVARTVDVEPPVPSSSAPATGWPSEGTPDDSDDSGPHDRWYVTPDGNADRFLGADDLPSVHLIDYGSGDGLVLRFCEDATGLLVGPTDRRLGPAGLLVSNLRGGSYYENDGGDFRPGADVRLVPEPDNPHDDRAVAVFDRTGRYRAGYLNKQKARVYLKRIAAGEHLVAISLRGTGPGRETGVVSILAATPDVLTHVRSPRPPGCPPPGFMG